MSDGRIEQTIASSTSSSNCCSRRSIAVLATTSATTRAPRSAAACSGALRAARHATACRSCRTACCASRRLFTRAAPQLSVPVSDLFRDPAYFAALRERRAAAAGHLSVAQDLGRGLQHRRGGRTRWPSCSTRRGLLERTHHLCHRHQPRIAARRPRRASTRSTACRASRATTRRPAARARSSDYYTAAYDRVVFDRRLRSARHVLRSLSRDRRVFAEVQLVSCRNVLIYFDRDAAGARRRAVPRRAGAARLPRPRARARACTGSASPASFESVVVASSGSTGGWRDRRLAGALRRMHPPSSSLAPRPAPSRRCAAAAAVAGRPAVAVLVVVHVPADRRSALPELFAQNACALALREAEDKMTPEPATVYFAPPGLSSAGRARWHAGALGRRAGQLLAAVDRRAVRIGRAAYGVAALGILLSGAARDGAAGLAHIRGAGGQTWVQTPETAQVPVMPRAALALAPHPTLDRPTWGAPLADWRTARDSSAPSPPRRSAQRRAACLVLAVDDVPDNLDVLEALLAQPGLRLLRASSGTRRSSCCCAHDVALALLDVQMPGMDGFELAELMRGAERTRMCRSSSSPPARPSPRGCSAATRPAPSTSCSSRSTRAAAQQGQRVHRAVSPAAAAGRAARGASTAAAHVGAALRRARARPADAARRDLSSGEALRLRTDERDAAADGATIRSASQRMTRLIAQLLDFGAARLGNLPMRPRRPTWALCETRDRRARGCAGNVRCTCSGDPPARGIPTALLQVLSNLLGNAVQHGDPTEPIVLRIDGREPDVVHIEVESGGVPARERARQPVRTLRARPSERPAAPASGSTSCTTSRARTAAARQSTSTTPPSLSPSSGPPSHAGTTMIRDSIGD